MCYAAQKYNYSTFLWSSQWATVPQDTKRKLKMKEKHLKIWQYSVKAYTGPDPAHNPALLKYLTTVTIPQAIPTSALCSTIEGTAAVRRVKPRHLGCFCFAPPTHWRRKTCHPASLQKSSSSSKRSKQSLKSVVTLNSNKETTDSRKSTYHVPPHRGDKEQPLVHLQL